MHNLQNLNAASHDWFVAEHADDVVTLRCRDTGHVMTVHFDELEAVL